MKLAFASPSPGQRIVHLLAGAVILANAGGNSMLRDGLTAAGPINSFAPAAYLRAFGNVWVIAGIITLVAWLILQLALLSWADLTYVLPVTSASYVLTMMIGVFGLGEHVPWPHWCGVALILLGVAIVSRTRPLTGRRSP